MAKPNQIKISADGGVKTTYHRRKFFIFSWWQRVRVDSVSSDLYIESGSWEIKNVFLDGKCIK